MRPCFVGANPTLPAAFTTEEVGSMSDKNPQGQAPKNPNKPARADVATGGARTEPGPPPVAASQSDEQARQVVATGGGRMTPSPEQASPPHQQPPNVATSKHGSNAPASTVPEGVVAQGELAHGRHDASRGARAGEPIMALIEHLRQTGAPTYAVEPLEDLWHEHQEATCEHGVNLLLSLEKENRINIGTVLRSGRWVHGSHWEPARAAQHNPDAEVKALRQQVEMLKDRLGETQARERAARAQLVHEQKRADQAVSEAGMLRAMLPNRGQDVTPPDRIPRDERGHPKPKEEDR